MTAYSARPDRFGDDAAAQPPAHAPLPVADLLHRRHAGRVPAAVRVRLRRHARRRARRGGRGSRRSTSPTSSRDPAGHHRRRRPGHGDLGRDGHDRGHRRPLPDHGHLPRVGPDRSRRGQRHPGDARGRHRDGRRGAHRLPAHDRPGRVARGRRAAGAGRAGHHLAGRRAGHGHQERRDRQQPADVPGAPALPRQRLRADRVDARPACAGSPRTSRSRRSSRRCGACCSARPSATAA